MSDAQRTPAVHKTAVLAIILASHLMIALEFSATGAAPEDAGAASRLVNVAHQLGGSLGLGILVTVFAAAGSDTLTGHVLLGHRVAVSLTVGTAMLALALAPAVALIARPHETAEVPENGPARSASA